MNDIDLSSYSNWMPIGDSSFSGFTGTLDGNGYTISNLTINRHDEDEVGLLAKITDAEIKNLGLENADVSGQNNVGGLAGIASGNVNISNCYVSGSITGQESVGGLAGYSNLLGITILSCYAKGSVTGNENTGGLLGQGGAIFDSYASNTVTGNIYTGGLVGVTNGTISNCYTNGVVNSAGSYTGGISGSGGEIKNSFTTAIVAGKDLTGGISGANAFISNCYSVGKITGKNTVGGIIGLNGLSVKDCIFDKEKTGCFSSIGTHGGGTNSNNKGLSSSEMQDSANWSGWDTSIWDFSEYPPKLKWQEPLKEPIDPAPPPDPDKPGDGTGGAGDVPIPGAVRLQIGSDSSSTSAIYVDTSFDLGAFDVDFSSADSCAAAIEDIDEVLSRINTKRSEFGAVINRLSSILESQTTTIQNFTSAQSTIMDADIANESADFVKNQILQQTSSALLAQSQNLHASIVLSLIG